MTLTEKDIAKLKYEKRIGYLIPTIIFCIGFCIHLLFLFQSKNGYHINHIIIDFGILVLCLFISYLINRNINKDLKTGAKTIKIETVERKESKIIHEAGSGAMYIPGLANISSKLWGPKMRELIRYDFIINNYKYIVEKDIYNKVQKGDSIEMHYSKHSQNLLSFEVVKNKY